MALLLSRFKRATKPSLTQIFNSDIDDLYVAFDGEVLLSIS